MKKRALFVGVDQYADQNIQDLHCAVNDATELAGFFKHRAGFDRAEALANPRNGEVVLERVRDMLDGLGGGDEFLFFFAGHGIKTGDGHRLVCAGDQLSEVQHSWAGLPLERLKANTTGAFDRLFLLDACRTDVHATHRGAGGAMEKGTRDLILCSAGQTSANGGELTIVCSCDDGECAGESLSLHHGLFTLAMLELLDEESRLGHRVRANDEFVYGRLPDRMRVLAERSDMVFCQKPQKRGPAILILDGSTDFPEHAADSGPSTGGRVAVPTLVVCPVCGKKNHPEDTFKCRGCGRDDLCHRHLDENTNLCTECTARASVNFGVKTHEWNVLLVNSGPRKIDVIKEIRAFTGLGLKESMNLVESAPVNVKENVPRSEAERLKRQLERVGASVELTVGEEEESESRTGPTKKEYHSGDWENSLVHAAEMGKVEISSRLRPDGSGVWELIAPADFRQNNHSDSSSGSDAQAKRKPSVPRVGRNDPCPCGSGKKYKKCCGQEEGLRWAAPMPPGRRAGETKTIVLPGGAELEMVWCPPGDFMMGSPEGEEGRDDNETQHHVTLTEGFWMAKYPVTQEQWQSVMGNNPAEHKGTNLPVVNVSWNDCVEFCRKAGHGLRLPTEAQWEYACRAGSTGAYAGTGRLEEMGWYKENSGNATHPVGQKRANAWGLYDMHGNVLEWCADWAAGGYYAQSPVENPKGPASGEYRVLRGGSYWNGPQSCRSALRNGDIPGFRRRLIGFRPVARQD